MDLSQSPFLDSDHHDFEQNIDSNSYIYDLSQHVCKQNIDQITIFGYSDITSNVLNHEREPSLTRSFPLENAIYKFEPLRLKNAKASSFKVGFSDQKTQVIQLRRSITNDWRKINWAKVKNDLCYILVWLSINKILSQTFQQKIKYIIQKLKREIKLKTIQEIELSLLLLMNYLYKSRYNAIVGLHLTCVENKLLKIAYNYQIDWLDTNSSNSQFQRKKELPSEQPHVFDNTNINTNEVTINNEIYVPNVVLMKNLFIIEKLQDSGENKENFSFQDVSFSLCKTPNEFSKYYTRMHIGTSAYPIGFRQRQENAAGVMNSLHKLKPDHQYSNLQTGQEPNMDQTFLHRSGLNNRQGDPHPGDGSIIFNGKKSSRDHFEIIRINRFFESSLIGYQLSLTNRTQVQNITGTAIFTIISSIGFTLPNIACRIDSEAHPENLINKHVLQCCECSVRKECTWIRNDRRIQDVEFHMMQLLDSHLGMCEFRFADRFESAAQSADSSRLNKTRISGILKKYLTIRLPHSIRAMVPGVRA